MSESTEDFQFVLHLWDTYRPLIQEGYRVLDKTLVLGLPATSMPAESAKKDSGIGSPFGEGAARVWRFWHGIISKIMQGPIGKTDAKTWHSPYLSSWDYNPFFLDLENLVKQHLLSRKTLNKIYRSPKKQAYIDFQQVEKDYELALTEAYKKSESPLSFTAFCNQLVKRQLIRSSFTYIGDIPINVPKRVNERHPEWFLPDWSLGAPPDAYSATPQIWGFPVLNPNTLFLKDKKHSLGPAGRMFRKLIRFYFSANKGGIRIDHFIGWVNPYCYYTGKKKYKSGRLYTSPRHPVLKAYFLKDRHEQRKMVAEFLLPFFREFNLTSMDIYP